MINAHLSTIAIPSVAAGVLALNAIAWSISETLSPQHLVMIQTF